jgi:hypothetical protein
LENGNSRISSGCAPLSSVSSTKWIWRTPPLRGDPLPSLARDLPAPTTSGHEATVVSLAVLVMCFYGVGGGRAAQVEASLLGAPCAAMPPPVKSSLGRAWSAVRELPRHAGQVCTWALVSASSSFSFPLHLHGRSHLPSGP